MIMTPMIASPPAGSTMVEAFVSGIVQSRVIYVQAVVSITTLASTNNLTSDSMSELVLSQLVVL
ncbi:MAG: hypothetical protein IH606_12050 [Burkholderiales bacterium]|nr:hypothetical protein [Burkholderiales bacterium]